MTTEWVEITVDVTPQSEEAIANLLCELGSNGVVTDDGSAGRPAVSGYLPAGERIQERLAAVKTLWSELCELGLASGACQPKVRSVPMSDWTGWQARFRPVKVSDRIVIMPPWATVTLKPEQVAVEIVPGLAFGTGEHETTRLCLLALEEFVKPGDRVLDTGTGSGILAIAAVKLGASGVIAVEIDDMALESARENVDRNGVADSIGLYEGSIDHPSVTGSFRIIVSNTETRTIRTLLTGFRNRLEANGVLILSGVLVEESEALAQDIAAHRFKITEASTDGEWWSCAARPV